MKVAFLVPTLDILGAAVQMENQYFLISDIMPLCRKVQMAKYDADNTIVYINIDKTIQSAGKYLAGVFTVSTNWQRLDNTSVESWKNFQKSVTVATFTRGTTYLIPVASFAALNMIPDFQALNIAGSTTMFSQTMFMYQCGEDVDLMNQTSIAGCITVELQGAVLAAADTLRAEIKKEELKNIALSTGVPVQIVNTPQVQNSANQLTRPRLTLS